MSKWAVPALVLLLAIAVGGFFATGGAHGRLTTPATQPGQAHKASQGEAAAAEKRSSSNQMSTPRQAEAEVTMPPIEAEVVEQDNNTNCVHWAASGECKANPTFMLTSCKVACRNAGLPPGQSLRDTWHSESECMAWAGSGECVNNAQFMESNCALSCHKLVAAREEYKARCPTSPDATPALAPGAMNATFSRVMDEFGHLEPEMISDDPPVLLFHRFIDEQEADAFIAHGKGKYTESRGVGVDKDGKMTDVKTEIRTSSHTWCQDAACLADPMVKRVMARVADVSGTPEDNAEFAQLVYYRACPEDGHPDCAFYRRHSDYIEGDQFRVQGVRIYTLFMYLNDVDEGGGTRFTDLPDGPVMFQPQRGKAILWPSVLWDKPSTIDPRTHHEALPVTKGEKFGANFWIHNYDFKGPHARGCTM